MLEKHGKSSFAISSDLIAAYRLQNGFSNRMSFAIGKYKSFQVVNYDLYVNTFISVSSNNRPCHTCPDCDDKICCKFLM